MWIGSSGKEVSVHTEKVYKHTHTHTLGMILARQRARDSPHVAALQMLQLVLDSHRRHERRTLRAVMWQRHGTVQAIVSPLAPQCNFFRTTISRTHQIFDITAKTSMRKASPPTKSARSPGGSDQLGKWTVH